MKRFLLIVSIILPLAAMSALGRQVTKGSVSAFISECRSCEGAEVVRLGPLATGAIKSVIRIAAKEDPDARDAVRLVKGIRGISVFDFEDCSEADRNHIIRRLDNILRGSEVLMEVSDNGERMNLYGVYDEKSDTVRDFIMYAPSSCALICLFGAISMKTLAKLADND